jgi:hypothetical protein
MRWIIAIAALVVVAIPAANAASPTADTPKPARAQNAEDTAAAQCKAERQRIGVQAFKATYGTNKNKANAFGKCVSAKSKDKAEDGAEDANEDAGAAAKACRAERASTGAEAFARKYGTNHNLKNAFGKCVSSKSKAKND